MWKLEVIIHIYIYILYVPYLFSVSNVGPEIHDLYRYKWLKLFAARPRTSYSKHIVVFLAQYLRNAVSGMVQQVNSNSKNMWVFHSHAPKVTSINQTKHDSLSFPGTHKLVLPKALHNAPA